VAQPSAAATAAAVAAAAAAQVGESEDEEIPPKRRLFVPETPSPKRLKYNESEESDEESSEESDVDEQAEEILFGPANPDSVPFKELDGYLSYNVAVIAYDYFADPEDFFYLSLEDIKKM
jgi:hypothetical protein